MRPGSFATLCFALLFAASALAQEEQFPAVEPPAIGWLPSLADMEAAGAIIGEIRVNPQNIFDASDPKENNFLYRIANAIHVVSREGVVRKTLLFKTGDKLSMRVLEETERVMRATLQIYAVRIRPVRYQNGVVDLDVETRDRWTLDPSVSFSRTGGVNSDRFSIKEDNLLGTGTAIGYTRSSNVDRTSDTFSISHPHALGPFTMASYSYSDTSDGRQWGLNINRNFFALDNRTAWGVQTGAYSRAESVYVGGVNTGTYRHEHAEGNAFYGWSTGLVDGWTQRHTVGISSEDNGYRAIPGESPAGEIPADLTLTGPYYRFDLIQDQFRTMMNLGQIGKPEDFNIGLDMRIQLGRSLSFLGSTQQQWVYSLALSKGAEFSGRALSRNQLSFTGRYGGSGYQQQLSQVESDLFYRQGGGFTFFGFFNAQMVRNPDVPNSLTIGGDTDLRGYPLRYQSGDKRMLLNLEERLYTNWNPFRLVRVGGAVFYDGGRAWGGDNPNTVNSGWLNDVGFGLRLLTDRSSRGNVLHLDVAFPLNREPGIPNVQYLVYTKIAL